DRAGIDDESPRGLVEQVSPLTAGGNIAGDGAVADRERPVVVDAAAYRGGGVAGQGAVADRQRPEVGKGAGAVGRGSGQGAVADRQRAEVDNGPPHPQPPEGCGVAGKAAISDEVRDRAGFEDGAANGGGILGEGGVRDGEQPDVVNGAAPSGEPQCRVAGE